MSRRLFITALVAAAYTSGVRAQCQQIDGNYYCAQTDAIIFNDVGFSGSYNEITNMDSTSCQCASSPRSFSGPLAPLNDEVSLHIRGPIQLNQLAVYHRSSSSSKVKRDAEAEAEAEAEPEYHGHGPNLPALARHKRGHAHRHERRDGGKVVTVTETVFSTTTRRKSDATSPATPDSAPAVTPGAGAQSNVASGVAANSSNDWNRDSYYNAPTGENTNIVFMNHLGGTNGSGVWDSCFGNSLSFANTDGVTAAQSPQTLGNVLIPSNNELAIFSGTPCGDCGYVRPGSPAYRGFSTSGDTLFLMDFTMPRDAGSGFNIDMSAAWFLHAQIPRTLQYGNAACSCWTSGCGEFDAFEILSTGSNFLTATLHSWQGTGTQYGGGGCSDYINRPLTPSMKAAVLFSASSKAIKIYTLPASATFDAGFADSIVEGWCSGSGSQVNIAG